MLFLFASLPAQQEARARQEAALHQALTALAAGDQDAIGQVYEHSRAAVYALAL